jgi:hypothetical protein
MSHWVSFDMTVAMADDICDLLFQRILAEGYSVKSVDSGKHVYVRNMDLVSRGAFLLSGGTWDKAPTTLTVSFIPSPNEILVRFKFEVDGSHSKKEALGMQQFFQCEFNSFLKHVNAWLAAP